MKYGMAEKEAKRLTGETGVKHKAVERERVDEDGFTVAEWFVEPETQQPRSASRGMSLEEAKAYQEQANRERPFGLSWEKLESMQGGKLKK